MSHSRAGQVTDNSMTAYSKNPRTKWVLEWPGMVVICVDMCYWTSMGEESLPPSQPTMRCEVWMKCDCIYTPVIAVYLYLAAFIAVSL